MFTVHGEQREQYADLVRVGTAGADVDVQAAEFVLVEGEGHDLKRECKSCASEAVSMVLDWTRQYGYSIGSMVAF